MAEEGERLLLQIHDFAEDGRPDNFTVLRESSRPYPMADHVHYALLNSRDRQFLTRAGIPETQVHALPNPIAVSSDGRRDEKVTPRDVELILGVRPTSPITTTSVSSSMSRSDKSSISELRARSSEGRGVLCSFCWLRLSSIMF